ncbi:MAG: MmoB/DmpM family protein [Deltaproteobacteria bacterium]|nr:MmoB/DmpM family protein [Deltaproteobacteria bacterium]
MEDRFIVGPVLLCGSISDAIVEAIRIENPNVIVIDRGAYVRVAVAGRCRVSRAMIESRLGREFRIPRDLEAVMTSFEGRLSMSGDEAVWSARD